MENRNWAFDWATRTHVPLTPTDPLWMHTGSYEGPTGVEIDLHPGLEVGVMLSGQAERHYPGVCIPGRPGDVWLCAMWEPHGHRVLLPGAERVVLLFLPDFLGNEMLGDLPWLTLFAAPPHQRPLVKSPATRRLALAAGQKLREDFVAQLPGWQTAVRLDLLRLLLDLSRGWHPPVSVEVQFAYPTHMNRVMPALRRLHERGGFRLSLEEAAAACNLAQTRFSFLFRQTMGLSFAQFRLRARLSSATRLLLTSDFPIDDIAVRTGFSDGSHLHRAFVRQYGCTPATYRRTIRGSSRPEARVSSRPPG